MKMIIAPPGAGKTRVAALIATAIDADRVLPLRLIYRRITERFGPDWYFNPVATQLKDFEMGTLRLKIEPEISDRNILLTAETGLARLTDTIFVALPDAAALYAATQSRTPPDYVYPTKEVADKICDYYYHWAKGSHIKVFHHVEDAVVAMMD